MQTLVRFWSAIIELVRNSLGWRDFFTLSVADVLFGHYDGRMPKLIPLHVPAGVMCVTTSH